MGILLKSLPRHTTFQELNASSALNKAIHHYQFGAVAAFVALHLATLGVLFVHFRWSYVTLMAAVYAVRMFGVTAGYHRYFSHRSFKLNRFNQFLMAVLAQSWARKVCCGGRRTIACTIGTPTSSRTSTLQGYGASGGRTRAGSSPTTTTNMIQA